MSGFNTSLLSRVSRTRRTLSVAIGALAVGATLGAAPAWAAWPNDRPIELIVGFAAGGGTDITARTVAQYLTTKTRARVVVVNKAGASGEIGLSYVAKAKPDGYTLGMTNMPGLVTLPIERQGKGQFSSSDFAYIANLVRDPSAFSVLASSKYKNLNDLIADAKARPGEITYGSTGVGTDDHLAMVLFQRMTGAKFNHIPYNGAGPLRTAVLGDQVVIGGMNLGEVMPFREKVRIIAQASPDRAKLAPDVPSFKEQGVNLVFNSERGVVAPKAIPEDVRTKLTAALREIAADPEFQKQMANQFTEMDYIEGDAWKARLEKQTEGFKTIWNETPWSDK